MTDDATRELIVEHRQMLKELQNLGTDHEKRIRLIERALIILMTVLVVAKLLLFK